jgi:dTDP-4-amino-4,6-dideoxygalactose transaminase
LKVPLLDLKAQYVTIEDEITRAINEVCKSSQFVLGPFVKNFEEEIAKYCEAKWAIGVASGTDALTLSLEAIGIKPGDEVITTPPIPFLLRLVPYPD